MALTPGPAFFPDDALPPPVCGISQCLLGDPVRYDGNHCRQAVILDALGPRVAWRACCPERLAGLGVPRPPVELVLTDGALRVRGRDDHALDVTRPLNDTTAALTDAWHTQPELHGFILKARSPSCGLGSTPVHDEAGREQGLGDGVLAAALRQRLPWLPLAEDTVLTTADACRAFYARLRLTREAFHAHETGCWTDFVAHHQAHTDPLQNTHSTDDLTAWLTRIHWGDATPRGAEGRG